MPIFSSSPVQALLQLFLILSAEKERKVALIEAVLQLVDSLGVDKLQGTSGHQGFLPNGSFHYTHLPQVSK